MENQIFQVGEAEGNFEYDNSYLTHFILLKSQLSRYGRLQGKEMCLV
jgi:hypothetical protein